MAALTSSFATPFPSMLEGTTVVYKSTSLKILETNQRLYVKEIKIVEKNFKSKTFAKNYKDQPRQHNYTKKNFHFINFVNIYVN